MAPFPTPPPPPPPPLPVNPPQNHTEQPSFFEKWIEQNKPPKKQPLRHTRAYYQNQCLIPMTTPTEAIPDVESIASLANNPDIISDGDGDDDAFEWRTALQDFRQIISLCASYKHTSDINRREFEYKKKQWNLSKENNHQQQSHAHEEDEELFNPPPHHEEYTPLKFTQNYILANIHGINHKMCLARATCPERTESLVSCLRGVDPNVVHALAKQGLGALVCLEERRAVERCVGSGVQRVVKEALG
ncbi:hypothetical protein HJC23_010701 [Cyclotella cryptica]|uniref:Uncharacterized protein n=1 Tax=Cyclotella cryptica TaxID=29204 RepID=A0ABD3NKQ6_9STRA|eukprot:CCRYP_020770-RA/>CCRYP_020770-RA protein AED:0.24 eAED:0.24 QI:0/-1/0/1/-1/1/1/0/245